jgi:hypothetical protein
MAESLLGFMGEDVALPTGATAELIDVQPVRYKLELFTKDNQLEPVATFHTEGGWNVEGRFLCTYEAGLKHGHAIPGGTEFIRCVEIVDKPWKHAMDEDEGLDAIGTEILPDDVEVISDAADK